MFKLLRALLAFATLRLMLLPLTAGLLFAAVCFLWFQPSEAAPEPARVVPVSQEGEGGGERETAGFTGAIRRFSAGARVLIWLAVVAALPFAGWKVVQWSMKRDSNAASGALLVGLTAAGVLLTLLLLGFRIVGGWEIALVAVAAVLAIVYNFVACEWLAERTG